MKREDTNDGNRMRSKRSLDISDHLDYYKIFVKIVRLKL